MPRWTTREELHRLADLASGLANAEYSYDRDIAGWRLVEKMMGRNISPRVAKRWRMKEWMEAFITGLEEARR